MPTERKEAFLKSRIVFATTFVLGVGSISAKAQSINSVYTTILKGKVLPLALIVRFTASEDASQPNKTTSYLVVSKITTEAVCVTDKISAGTKANEEARRAADLSGTKPCLKKP